MSEEGTETKDLSYDSNPFVSVLLMHIVSELQCKIYITKKNNNKIKMHRRFSLSEDTLTFDTLTRLSH